MCPVLAIDIGGTKTIVGIINEKGTALYYKKFSTLEDKDTSPGKILYRCVQEAKAGLESLNLKQDRLTGIGVSVPGMADSKNGILLKAPYLGWENIPIVNSLQPYFPEKKIKIDNDVNACAIGELLFGKGSIYNNFIWVTISTGIGASLVLNKELYTGSSGIAGELGHVKVDWENGNLCTCGNYGCLEAHASGTAISEEARKNITSGSYQGLESYFKRSGKEVTADNIAIAARSGLEEAKNIYFKAGVYLGMALSHAVNILNPEAVIIGGGVAGAFDLLKPGIDKTLFKAVIGETNRNVVVTTTELGYQAALIGAAGLIYQDRGR